MSKEQFEETDGTKTIREQITRIVGVRVEISQIAKYLKEYPDYENVVAELDEAIATLYQAEKNLGDAHQYLLVANAMMAAEMN